ncbi:hypothetical protein OQA88_6792 [Cercophora sp. LCS_1]
MSIARAFTTRRVKQSLMAADASDASPQRSNTTKSAIGSIRHKISAPVELIHTTNMLSYNAPDIYPKTASSTTSSHKSDDELSDSAHTTASSPPTSPDIEAPKRSLPAKPNHLSAFFTVPEGNSAPPSKVETPVIPQRAASHTKKSYDSLVRQRSSSRMSEQSQRSVSTKASMTFSRSSSASTSTTATSQSASPPQHKAKPSSSQTVASSQPKVTVAPQFSSQSQLNHRKDFSQSQHPFGPELAQVSEIAEEYGIKAQVNEIDLEAQELAAKGLQKFSAEDYMSEIQGLISSFFTDSKPMATAMWI